MSEIFQQTEELNQNSRDLVNPQQHAKKVHATPRFPGSNGQYLQRPYLHGFAEICADLIDPILVIMAIQIF